MQRQQFQVFFGGLVVTVRPPLVHLSIRGEPSARTCKRLGPPLLHDGERADHLTIPLAPQPHGSNAGKYDFHLTYFDGGRRHHETVAAVAPEDIEAAFRPLAEELFAYYMRTVRRVTVQDLRRDGFFAVLPSEEIKERAVQLLNQRRPELRLNQASFERFGQQLECYEPEVLDDLTADMERESVMMVSERDASAIFVGYRPNGLGPDHPPGWYAMPADQSIGEIFERVFTLGLGPAFYDAMITIARELQMEIDVDELERGRARAVATRAPQLRSPR